MLLTVASELKDLDARQLSDELERGRIVHFPRCPVALPSEDDLEFLRSELTQYVVGKNVSYYPEADRLVGLKASGEVMARTHQILHQYSSDLHGFLSRTMPEFFSGCRTGISSFRPLQEKGRNLKPHASNELVHVDAGAYGATHGDRILRFFTNIHPREDRVWISKGTFSELYGRYAAAAGLMPPNRRLKEGVLDRAYSGLVRIASHSLPMLQLLDSSPYDRQMRKFHNYLKDTPAFQHDPHGLLRFSFKPFSSWMVLTDAVSHACISGQYALADTFLIPLRNCRLFALAPYAILSRFSPAVEGLGRHD